MRYRPIRILGRRYRIVPSLENMCNLEEQTNSNLLLGINPRQVNLRFARAVIENIIEDEDGHHLSPAALDELYSENIGECQRIFLMCYREMYTLPPAESHAVKNALRRRRL